MDALNDMQEAKKAKQIKKMKKLFFWSIALLFCTNMIQQNINFEIPHLVTMLFSMGIWWGGLGWLWQKFKFRKADDL